MVGPRPLYKALLRYSSSILCKHDVSASVVVSMMYVDVGFGRLFRGNQKIMSEIGF
jgi:hypothetical protein